MTNTKAASKEAAFHVQKACLSFSIDRLFELFNQFLNRQSAPAVIFD
jgi:hypothetical protein